MTEDSCDALKTEKVIFQTKWIAVKETPRGFQFLERKGRDSVAVFLVRGNPISQFEVLVRFQPLCVHNAALDEEMKLYACPITGGMEEGEGYTECAIRETLEEAGYTLDLEQIKKLGSYITGTQSNETVVMFWADVTGMEPGFAAQDGSVHEAASKNEWRSLSELKDYEYGACQLGYYKLMGKLMGDRHA
ncbi:NUDIX hydrolase [Leptolyngbya sp. FACHB-541]|uniref:NUDIX hydrolase n=1 Tax=Leptolyngbya sp. FACHB-541 TaxID=2692810 RepID=UPI001685E923|nr:NUDIX hydrolase [Leptolyngbya sp. FACHB-541]MBD1995264.1 NUDIX hydrolase [Leptolyngbya sp. FACHB-541]